ncbi:hypothetical protein MKK63_16870 [Methylobacterium sp. J-088]|uniref:hypothetical protein n=1 Tax=Methylobacterium sp. J-088 TaxID=2836664 RepID=UPI001FB9E827|nr:hypothetical protein [Methylobacterium sp. J-088]MCJ2064374.1 hypothetical protein [Methylobacterium sp. J-088]
MVSTKLSNANPSNQAVRPSLKERVAALKALAVRAVRLDAAPPPEPQPNPVDWYSPPPGFMSYPEREPMSFLNIPEGLRLELERLRNIAELEVERVVEMTGENVHEAMRAGIESRMRRRLRLDGIEAALAPEVPASAGVEDYAGLIYYEDATGNARRAPVAAWINFTAMRLYTVARQEMSRQFNAQCGGLDEAGNRALDAKLRRELRIDALFALTFHSHKVFEAADLRRYGTEEEIAAAAPEIEVDPVHEAIEAVRRCLLDCVAAQKIPQPPGHIDPLPEQEAAHTALHVSLDALKVTVPTTARGCAALARFAVEFHASEDFAVDEDERGQQHLRVLDLIARSPALLRPKTTQHSPPSLVDQIDFASASLEDLQALNDLSDHVGTFAYALVWTGRCHTQGWDESKNLGDQYNAAGKLMRWLGDALTDVETAANEEARRRRPTTPCDRETRLSTLAATTIGNGDPDEIEAFARDLTAHAEAARRGR